MSNAQTAASKVAPVTDESIFSRIVPNDCRKPADADVAEVKSSVASFHRLGNRANELRALMLLGALYERLGEYQLALPFLQSALKLAKDDTAKAQILTMTADALTHADKSDAAVNDAAQAYKISKDPEARASALRARAEASFYSPGGTADDDLKNALSLIGDAGDSRMKAILLTDQAAGQQDAGSPFDTFNSALKIENQIQDCHDKIATLVGLATLEGDRGRMRDAQGHFDQAVALQDSVGDRTMESETLHQLAYFNWEIGDLGQALSYFNQSLKLKQALGDRFSESMTVAAIAGLDRDMQDPQAALSAYSKVLPTFTGKNRPWRIMVLNNLGTVEADLHNKTAARSYYNLSMQQAQSALLAQNIQDVTPAFSEWGIGELEQDDALPSYFRAARMARENELPDLEGMVDVSLMDHFRVHNQPNVAIFFGKRAVDQFQLIRRSMTGMSNDLTSSFLHKKADTYRTLAEILVDQKRLIEAQQVLDLLKIQQYSDYVGAQLSELSQPLPRSAREAQLQQQLEQQITQLVSLDKALVAAQGGNRRETPAVVQAQAALRKAETQFNTFLQDLYRQLEANDGPAIAVENVSGVELPLERLISNDSHSAAIYTLEGADCLRLILISHNGRLPHSYSISQVELDDKCRHFLEILKGRGDSTVAAEDLFTVIFAPVEKDLEDMGVKTLIWYLDGSLRYIPIAALWNSQTRRYLVEDYNIINFTPLNHALEEAPQLSGATAIGMGTSNIEYGRLRPLPNVQLELKSIVTDPAVNGSHGPLPGDILLDGRFTEKALKEDLKSQAVVHIASHFVLTPGNDDLSYLLLGGKDEPGKGYAYSMADFAKSKDVHIEGTKLLTLSACETAAENRRDVCFEKSKSTVAIAKCKAGEANQREDGVVMEGLSEAVLEKGAEAVISSLWSVDDRSTSEIMSDFYQRWVGSGGKLTKAEALRLAELDLIHGKAMLQSSVDGRGFSAIEDQAGKQPAPAGYAHPYYWAPFVLMGNWQ